MRLLTSLNEVAQAHLVHVSLRRYRGNSFPAVLVSATKTETEEQACPNSETQSANCQKSHQSSGCRVAVDEAPIERLSSTRADSSFDASHAMAYTHPAASLTRRVANPRRNACWGGTLASACRVANTGVQTFVGWDQFGNSVWVHVPLNCYFDSGHFTR